MRQPLFLILIAAAAAVPSASAAAQELAPSPAMPQAAAGEGGTPKPAPPVAFGELSDRTLDVFVSQTRSVLFPFPLARVAIADEHLADFKLISPDEIYLLGKAVGRTNLMVWPRGGAPYAITLDVGVDLAPLRKSILSAMPEETEITVASAGASIVLGGRASNTVAAQTAVSLAKAIALQLNQQLDAARGLASRADIASGESGAGMKDTVIGGSGFSEDPDKVVQVLDLIGVKAPQQVMLEVRIAEVSRSLAESLGVSLNGGNSAGSVSWGIGSGFAGTGAGQASLGYTSGGTLLGVNLDAEQRKGQAKILAEPNIVAISGKEASFNVGGRLLIPVAQGVGGASAGALTLEEREYGVGLKFTPAVLRDGRINLTVNSEVSEISKEPVSFSSGNITSVMPSFTTSRVSTTVELPSGQSLIIGGLIKNTSAATIKRFPLLGDLPILGALFRSHAFQSDKTELVIVIRPVLVSGSPEAPALPTDGVKDPSRTEMWLKGKVQGGGE